MKDSLSSTAFPRPTHTHCLHIWLRELFSLLNPITPTPDPVSDWRLLWRQRWQRRRRRQRRRHRCDGNQFNQRGWGRWWRKGTKHFAKSSSTSKRRTRARESLVLWPQNSRTPRSLAHSTHHTEPEPHLIKTNFQSNCKLCTCVRVCVCAHTTILRCKLRRAAGQDRQGLVL